MATILEQLGPLARRGITWMGRRRLPKVEGSLTLGGVSAPVEIWRDRWGIAHIFAKNQSDVFFAQGFVHAQDRLWQMELNRRTAQGRLSEIFGQIALDTDRTARTFGFNRLGLADLQAASGEIRQALESYSQGVNAFLEHCADQLPEEFALLRYRPQAWQSADSAAFSRLMVWQLSHAWFGEIVRAQLAERVGSQHAAELEIHYPSGNPLSLPDGIQFNRLDPQGRLIKAQGPFLDQGSGSNAWAVSGQRTQGGQAYLCNDMHLALSIPSLWYEVHLSAEDYQTSGVSLPGLPMVLVGHNARIAWGMTLAFTDCEDLFIERFDPNRAGYYEFKGEWRQAQVVEEPILVKGQREMFVEPVTITHHGPVISQVVGVPEQRLAVQSMALQPSPVMLGWLRLNQAGGWDDFVEAMRLIEAPQLNVAYADRDGNIGYWVTGRVPIRTQGYGEVPAPGWSGDYEWFGVVPFEEMPHALNPTQGYVLTCNQRIVPEKYPYFLGNVWMNGYRARRLAQMIESRDKLSSADFQAMQMDFTCLPAIEFAAILCSLESSQRDVQLVQEQMKGWNGDLGPQSTPGALYEVIRYSLVRNLFEPILGKELTNRLAGQGFHPLLFNSHEFYGHDTVTVMRLLNTPASWWVEQAGGREALLETSIHQALEWLRSNLGSDPGEWKWGRLHRVIFAHSLGMQKPLDQVFNRGPYPIGGDTDTPCATAMNPGDPYDNKVWAPSFRQIIDMRDFDRSLSIHPTGQSGRVASPHYDDFIPLWLQGEYHPMLWSREQIEQQVESRLILR